VAYFCVLSGSHLYCRLLSLLWMVQRLFGLLRPSGPAPNVKDIHRWTSTFSKQPTAEMGEAPVECGLAMIGAIFYLRE
jgi:hypothetical protein